MSEVRLKQTLYAEYPSHREKIEKLHGQKATQTLATLSELWEVSSQDCINYAEALATIGFFEKTGNFYRVPFIYRPALEMIQGEAKSTKGN